MGLLAWYRDRTRRRTDSEHVQALLRVTIVSLLLADTAWIAGRSPHGATALWTINISSFVISATIFRRVLFSATASPRRRIIGAVHDNLFATLWLLQAGPAGALALFVYPFVTVGNGFRYGVRYLTSSGALGTAGIAWLVFVAPSWRAQATIGTGVLLSHVVVTIYTGLLLARLHHTQEQLERAATHDALTGLPNRRYFMDWLTHAAAAPIPGNLACLYLDLDGFKSVNDQLGHKTGDQLLSRVGRELLGCVGAFGTLARLGGDEFTLIIGDARSEGDVVAVAQRVIRAIESIDEINGQPVSISASVGVAFMRTGASPPTTPEELRKAADEAMYAAKKGGRGGVRLEPSLRLVTLAVRG